MVFVFWYILFYSPSGSRCLKVCVKLNLLAYPITQTREKTTNGTVKPNQAEALTQLCAPCRLVWDGNAQGFAYKLGAVYLHIRGN